SSGPAVSARRAGSMSGRACSSLEYLHQQAFVAGLEKLHPRLFVDQVKDMDQQGAVVSVALHPSGSRCGGEDECEGSERLLIAQLETKLDEGRMALRVKRQGDPRHGQVGADDVESDGHGELGELAP